MSSHRPDPSNEIQLDGGKAAWIEPMVIRLHAGEAEGVDGVGTDAAGMLS